MNGFYELFGTYFKGYGCLYLLSVLTAREWATSLPCKKPDNKTIKFVLRQKISFLICSLCKWQCARLVLKYIEYVNDLLYKATAKVT